MFSDTNGILYAWLMQTAFTAPSSLLAGSFGEMGVVSTRYIINAGTFLIVRLVEWDNGWLRDGTEPLLRRVRQPGKAEKFKILGSDKPVSSLHGPLTSRVTSGKSPSPVDSKCFHHMRCLLWFHPRALIRILSTNCIYPTRLHFYLELIKMHVCSNGHRYLLRASYVCSR